MTRSSLDTWSIEPSASTEPSCNTVTFTPNSRTNAMSCSTTMTVRSRLISLSSSAVWRVSASVMPATGDARPQWRQPDDLQQLGDALVLRRAVVPEQGGTRPPVGLEGQAEIVLD